MPPDILHLHVPVPVPQIKKFSRWRVFLALFNRNAHFTTCEALQYQLYRETAQTTNATIERAKKAMMLNV